MEFLSTSNADGITVEDYMLHTLLPNYNRGLIALLVLITAVQFIPFALVVKLSITAGGLFFCAWMRYYNKKFLSLLWETVLSPIE